MSGQAVTILDITLDQVDIMNRLTRYGVAQGVYIGKDGEIYVNAKYVMDGNFKLYDYIDSKIAYVAMMTSTLLSGQATKEKIEAWYDVGLWSEAMVRSAESKGILTSADAAKILG